MHICRGREYIPIIFEFKVKSHKAYQKNSLVSRGRKDSSTNLEQGDKSSDKCRAVYQRVEVRLIDLVRNGTRELVLIAQPPPIVGNARSGLHVQWGCRS